MCKCVIRVSCLNLLYQLLCHVRRLTSRSKDGHDLSEDRRGFRTKEPDSGHSDGDDDDAESEEEEA